jgi:hypothetical protein
MQEAVGTVALGRPLDITLGESFVSVCCSRFSSDDFGSRARGTVRHFGNLASASISITCAVPKMCSFRERPTKPHFESTPDRLKCKQGAKRTAEGIGPSHSKRRISTGNSFAAARAGTIVARSDIPIATTEIHNPSIALGWNGT